MEKFILKNFRNFLLLGISLLFFFAFTTDTLAANRYWVGASGAYTNATSSWSTISGGTPGATVPGASDIAIFDGGANTNATVPADLSVAGLSVLTGYSATITINSGYSITNTATTTIQAGALSGALSSSANIVISGGDISALNLTITGSDTNLDVAPDGNLTINTLTINKSENYYLWIGSNDNLIVTATTTLTNGGLSNNDSYTGTFEARGNVVVASTWDQNSCSYTNYKFTGNANQSFITSANFICKIEIAKTGGTLNFSATVANSATFTSGTSTGTLSVASTANLIFNGGIMTGNVNIIGSGTFTYNSGDISNVNLITTCTGSCYFTSNGTSTINYLKVLNSSTVTFNLSSTTALVVNGNVDLYDGYLNNTAGYTGSLNVKGNLYYNLAWDGGTYGSIVISGTINQSVTGPQYNLGSLGTGLALIVSKPSGVLNFVGSTTVSGVNGAFLGGNSGNITFNSPSVITGTIGFGGNNSTITNNGADLSGLNLHTRCTNTCYFTSNGTSTINFLKLYNSNTVAFNLSSTTALVVNGNLDLLDGYLNNTAGYTGSLNVKGDLFCAPGWDGGAYGSIVISGTINQSVTGAVLNPTGLPTLPLIVSKPSGVLNFGVTNGLFYPMNSGNITFNSPSVITGTILFGGNNSTITNNGADLSGFKLHTKCINTCYFTSNGTSTINSLRVNNSNTVTFNLSSTTALVVNGNVDLMNGYLNSTAGYTGSLNVKGDLTTDSSWDGGSYGSINFSGTGDQRASTTINIANSTIIDKPSGSVIASSTSLLFTNLNVATGTLDLNSRNATITTFAVGGAGVLKLFGDESTVSTPTLATSSTVLYYGTNASTTVKNWSYKNLTINSSATSSVFVLPGHLSGLSTTTISSGVLYLNGNNLSLNYLVNNSTLKLQGREAIVPINGMSTNNGTVEYVGDGDSSADTYYLNDVLSYGNLKVNMTDTSDILTYAPSSNITNELFGYWKGEGNAVDSYSNHNGIELGTVSYITGRDGQAFSFSGDNDITNCISLDVNSVNCQDISTSSRPYDNFSFGAWIKTSATHGIDTASTTSTDGLSGQKYAFAASHVAGTSSGAGLSIGTNGLSVYEHGDSYMPPLAVYSGNVGSDWNYVTVTYENRKPRIYLNGHLVAELYTSPKEKVYVPFAFGTGRFGAFAGQMDEVRLYSKTLSANEVASLYGNAVGADNDYSLTLTGDLTVVSGTLNAPDLPVIMDGANQTIQVLSTTTIKSLVKNNTSSSDTLYFSASSSTPIIIKGSTTLEGTSEYPLLLHSTATDTQWFFDPQGTRNFSYLTVQDSYNINNIVIDDILGYVDLGNNVGWSSFSYSITVGRQGVQIATTTIPATNVDLGGAFTFMKEGRSDTITSITLTQNGTLSDSYLENLRLYYETATTCASVKPDNATHFGDGSAFVNNRSTTTGTLLVGKDSVCLYVVYDIVGDLTSTSTGQTIDLQISNPEVDVIAQGGAPTVNTPVNIYRNTIIYNSGIQSLISLHVQDPVKNPTVYYLQDYTVWKKEGDGEPYRISNPDLKIYELNFTNLSGADGILKYVKTEIVTSNIGLGEESAFPVVTRSLQTTSGVLTQYGGN